MAFTRSAKNEGALHFVTLPNTGIQICRGFPIPDKSRLGLTPDELWEAAKQKVKASADVEILKLITEHVACNTKLEATGWIACDPAEMAFFRLTRTAKAMPISADLVIDTNAGAGKQIRNRVDCLVEKGFLLAQQYHLASFFVEAHAEAKAVEGSLVMDFGNSGSAFIFSRTGSGSMKSPVIPIHNPFDPEYRKRTPDQRSIFKSGLIVLRTEENPKSDPWLVMGARSEELIRRQPLATYLYAPKKYVRNWPEHLKDKAPTMSFRGVLGQRAGLHQMTYFVEQAISHLLKLVVSSLTNPGFNAHEPECSPMFQRIMLTYPLTWREADKTLFKDNVRKAALELFHLPKRLRDAFQVEMVCSEPVGVAAYVLWETIFHFGAENLTLAGSLLGNLAGTPELRLLVVDIGGGSTDIALVQVGWSVRESDQTVDVTFRLLESMRFNRAGDRLSHLLATAIWAFFRRKYGIEETLEFKDLDSNPKFALNYRRQAVSDICRIAEQAKVGISRDGTWTLEEVDEGNLLGCFEVLGLTSDARPSEPPRLVISGDTLREWVESDQQSRRTNGEPGFMNIFHYLKELRDSLEPKDRLPHLVMLSGRTTRLPFIRDLTAENLEMPLHRIRTLDDLLPDTLKGPDHADLDKLAVVRGAQRFRFSDNVRFVSLPDEPIFNRYIGLVRSSSSGLELLGIPPIKPGDVRPRTLPIDIDPGQDVRIGHAFRQNGIAEVIANISNTSPTRRHTISVDILDDFTVRMAPNADLLFSEWVPGGSDIIVDNFNDTGLIDNEPPGLIEEIVLGNVDQWIRKEAIHAGAQK